MDFAEVGHFIYFFESQGVRWCHRVEHIMSSLSYGPQYTDLDCQIWMIYFSNVITLKEVLQQLCITNHGTLLWVTVWKLLINHLTHLALHLACLQAQRFSNVGGNQFLLL